MDTRLRVLMVEDSEDDATLNLLELKKAYSTVEHQRVDTEQSMREALASSSWDVILLDYSIPGFDAPRALEIASRHDPDLPVILVSGLVGELTAVELMRAGVRDYVVKDSLARLPPAIARELEGAEVRREGRRAERASRESDARYRAVVEASQDSILVQDTEQRVIFANQAAIEMFGYTLDELRARDLRPFVHPDDVGQSEEWRRNIRSSDPTARRYVGRRVRKDGSVFLAEVSLAPLVTDGETTGAVVDVRDVTERVEAEDALRTSEERFRTVFESSRSGLVVFDGQGRAELFNDALCEMLGYTQEEMRSMPLAHILAPQDRELVYSRIASVTHEESIASQFAVRLIRKDGQIIHVEGTDSQFYLADGTARVLVDIRDVTDEKRLKEQLLVAQKSEALGTLVAGVAHDFNNLLTAIGGNIELAQREQPDSRWLENADVATTRAVKLVRQLLQFARRGDAERAAVSLAEVGRQVLELVSETLDRRISLDIEIADGVPVVWADAGQIEQVMMNLLVNARDAVLARVAADPEDADYVPTVGMSVGMCGSRDCPREAGGCVTLAVWDNGVGMPPEVRELVFDPFFTTKGPGEGTGLGLSMAYGIVDDHGGALTVVSEVGEGTTFTVELPVAVEAAPPASDATSSPAGVEPVPVGALGGAKGSVLLVDDEQLSLAFAGETLTRAGYDVVAVPTGEEALRAIVERRFDVALVDILMPAPDGWEVLAQIQETAPETRVVMASGHALAQQVEERGAAGFLKKPYGLSALLHAIEEHVGKAAADAF